MAQGILESQNFDRYMSLSEKQHRHAALAANDAFAAAMTSAVRRGREHVAPGTFVDLTPSYARPGRERELGLRLAGTDVF